MTKDKIKASHILVMHNESRDSRSDITKEKAKKSIDQIYKNVVDGKTTFGDAAVKLTAPPLNMEVIWVNLEEE